MAVVLKHVLKTLNARLKLSLQMRYFLRTHEQAEFFSDPAKLLVFEDASRFKSTNGRILAVRQKQYLTTLLHYRIINVLNFYGLKKARFDEATIF